MIGLRIGDFEFSPRKNKFIVKKVDKKEVKEMKKNKYKVGERYVFVDSYRKGDVIEITTVNYVDKVISFKNINKSEFSHGRFEFGSNYDKWLKPINKQEIHITTDGFKNTYGILKENGKVVKEVQARLHPSDTFDFMVGSSIVMGRLFEGVKEDAPEIKVGDMVKVTDTRGTYILYQAWFKQNGCEYLESHFVEGKYPMYNHEYKVVAVGGNRTFKNRSLYAIQDLDTTQVFVIDGKGIEKV